MRVSRSVQIQKSNGITPVAFELRYCRAYFFSAIYVYMSSKDFDLGTMAEQPEWKPMVEKTIAELEEALTELRKTWEGIGCTRETRAMYYDQAYDHIKDLLSEMVAESQAKKQLLLESIEELLKQTTVLYTELHLEMEPKNYEQIPLSKVEQMLRTDLKNLECLKKERLMVLKELLTKEYDICNRLGVQRLNLSAETLPTEEELDSFKMYLQKQENERNRLETIFTDMRCSIVKMMNDLNVVPSLFFERLICDNPADFVLNTSNMTKLREFRDQLKVQMEETKWRVDKMKEDLLALWKYIDEPADIYQSFLDRYTGYSTVTVNAYTLEVKRCKEKRKENICKYVTQIRSELMDLWNLCKYSEAQRNTFAPFFCSTFTEDLLTLHELEAERLRKFYDDNQVIFELLEERENLLMKIKELLQRANNPDRFHNRGGQLLMEEKERKVIQKKLPKIEAKLRQLIEEYEHSNNEMFTINGISLENVLAESWETLNLEKETIKKARKEAKDKSVKKSPLNSSKRTPGLSHLSIHKVPTPKSTSKRKLFSPSPNTSAKRRNKTSDKNKPTVAVSKIRRSGKIPKVMVQKVHKMSKGTQKRKDSPNTSITNTTYNQFQVHMTDREELHSSMLPEQILRNTNKSNIKPPVRTPAKPLRKNLSAAATPTHSSSRKMPHSPRMNTPKLAAAPSNLPFIF